MSSTVTCAKPARGRVADAALRRAWRVGVFLPIATPDLAAPVQLASRRRRLHRDGGWSPCHRSPLCLQYNIAGSAPTPPDPGPRRRGSGVVPGAHPRHESPRYNNACQQANIEERSEHGRRAEGAEAIAGRLRIAVARLSRRLRPPTRPARSPRRRSTSSWRQTTRTDPYVGPRRVHRPQPDDALRLIPKLEEGGLIERSAGEADRRVWRVDTTRKRATAAGASAVGAQRRLVQAARRARQRAAPGARGRVYRCGGAGGNGCSVDATVGGGGEQALSRCWPSGTAPSPPCRSRTPAATSSASPSRSWDVDAVGGPVLARVHPHALEHRARRGWSRCRPCPCCSSDRTGASSPTGSTSAS